MTDSTEFIPTRRSLLSGLKDSADQENWRRFFDTYWRLIYRTGIRAGLSHTEAEDLVQETVLAIFKGAAKFHHDPAKGSFKSWLMRLTGWRVADQFRRRGQVWEPSRRPPRTSTDTPTIERVPSPEKSGLEALWVEEWEENLLQAACEKIKSRVDPKHYQVFDLHVVKQWPVPKVARALNISRGSIYLIKHRINRLVKAEIRRLQARLP